MRREAKHSRSRRTPSARPIAEPMQGILTALSPALDRFSCKRHRRFPLLSQIFPARILRLNQRSLLRSSPAFQLFLTSNGLVNVIKALVVNQPIAVIFAGKSFALSPLMFQCAPVDAVRHANVECPRAAA